MGNSETGFIVHRKIIEFKLESLNVIQFLQLIHLHKAKCFTVKTKSEILENFALT